MSLSSVKIKIAFGPFRVKLNMINNQHVQSHISGLDVLLDRETCKIALYRRRVVQNCVSATGRCV